MTLYLICCLLIVLPPSIVTEDENDLVTEPTLCEACKFLTIELKDRLHVTGRSKEILRTGQGLDKKGKIAYHTSELRLIEALEDPHVCDKILEYKIHKEKKGSERFAKGRSETMETLHGLVNKGVKVEMGMPYEMWDQPPAEVTKLQKKCYRIVEQYEDEIEDWYYHHQDADLTEYFCKNIVLLKEESECLKEGKSISNENTKGDTDDVNKAPKPNAKHQHEDL